LYSSSIASTGLSNDFAGIPSALEASKTGWDEDKACGKTVEEGLGLCTHPAARKMNNTIKVR
jgi:hypothetical protein